MVAALFVGWTGGASRWHGNIATAVRVGIAALGMTRAGGRRGTVAFQRQNQNGDLLAQASHRPVRQRFGPHQTCRQRAQNRPPALAHAVRRHVRQFDVGLSFTCSCLASKATICCAMRCCISASGPDSQAGSERQTSFGLILPTARRYYPLQLVFINCCAPPAWITDFRK